MKQQHFLKKTDKKQQLKKWDAWVSRIKWLVDKNVPQTLIKLIIWFIDKFFF